MAFILTPEQVKLDEAIARISKRGKARIKKSPKPLPNPCLACPFREGNHKAFRDMVNKYRTAQGLPPFRSRGDFYIARLALKADMINADTTGWGLKYKCIEYSWSKCSPAIEASIHFGTIKQRYASLRPPPPEPPF